MRFATIIALITVLSALGLTYEIAAGRVLAPFFGTSLVTWTTVIAVVLAGFALGSALGGLVAERPRAAALRITARALVATAVLMAASPILLSLVYALGARGTGGMVAAVLVAFLPASVLVTLPSPLLAKMAVEARPGREGSSLGLVLAAGSLGAIAGAVLAGFVTLPLIGSAATFAACGAVALGCLLVLRRGGAGAVIAGLAVAASLAVGPACRWESGLSCIDVARQGAVTRLFSDRVQQAAERGGDGMVLSYTRWIWGRMQADLAPGAHVLFIGGGGYSLPAALLEVDPTARATVVEIDPLMTRVVAENLTWAGGWIGREAGDRLTIRHADGRVFLNEAEQRFDAVVMDAFSSGAVPAHLATVETYGQLRALSDGPVYVNLIDGPEARLARGVVAAIRVHYPHVEVFEGPRGSDGLANVVIAAAPAPLGDGAAVPDGYAPVTLAAARAFTDDRGWVGHR